MVCPIAAYESHTAELGLFRNPEIAKYTGSATLDASVDPPAIQSNLQPSPRHTECNARLITRVFSSPSRLPPIARELRTPINNILGRAEVVLTRARSIEEHREAITSSLEGSVRLSELIESLLLLSRADTPGIQLKREEIDVSAELAAVCEYYEAASQEGTTSAFRLLHRTGHSSTR